MMTNEYPAGSDTPVSCVSVKDPALWIYFLELNVLGHVVKGMVVGGKALQPGLALFYCRVVT